MTTDEKLPEKAPKRGGKDIAHAVVKASIGQVPGVGLPATALFEYLVRPSVERRNTEWVESIAEAINELRDRIADIAALQDDESFVTTLIAATNAAVRTHQAEKREALRNAVMNAALRNEPDDDLRATFLSHVERFTPWHLRILKLFNNPRAGMDALGVSYGNYHMGGPSTVLEDAYPEMRGQRAIYDQLVTDLSSAGLFGIGSLHSTMTADGMLSPRTTELGRRFLAFISEPPP